MPPVKKQKLHPEELTVGDKCTRCCEIIQADENGNPILTGCQVPHPEDLQMQIVAFFGGNGMEYTLRCQACGDSYTRTQSMQEMKDSEPGQITEILLPRQSYLFASRMFGRMSSQEGFGGHSS